MAAAESADPNGVKFIEVPFAQVAAALGRGTVSAGYIGEPVLLSALGVTTRSIGNPYAALGPQVLVCNWVTTRDWLAANHDLAKRFVAAMTETAQWANQHRELAAPILAKYSKIDLELIRGMRRSLLRDRTRPDDARAEPRRGLQIQSHSATRNGRGADDEAMIILPDPIFEVQRAGTRATYDFGWLRTNHSFSFADYYDPRNVNWGALRVFNDDYVAPGKGFGTHPHRDMEILTYVLSGKLEHRDSLGSHGIVGPGGVQFMSAGTGVQHSEFNHSATDELHFLQMWVLPGAYGGPPMYGQIEFDAADRSGKWLLVASGRASSGAPVQLTQDATFLGQPARGRNLAARVRAGPLGLSVRRLRRDDRRGIRSRRPAGRRRNGADGRRCGAQRGPVAHRRQRHRRGRSVGCPAPARRSKRLADDSARRTAARAAVRGDGARAAGPHCVAFGRSRGRCRRVDHARGQLRILQDRARGRRRGGKALRRRDDPTDDVRDRRVLRRDAADARHRFECRCPCAGVVAAHAHRPRRLPFHADGFGRCRRRARAHGRATRQHAPGVLRRGVGDRSGDRRRPL